MWQKSFEEDPIIETEPRGLFLYGAVQRVDAYDTKFKRKSSAVKDCCCLQKVDLVLYQIQASHVE